MAFATQQELLNIEDISQYLHQVNVSIELERASSAIVRLLNTIWWQKFQLANPHLMDAKLDANLLVRSEWTNPSIYYSLAYLILPKLPGDWTHKIADYHFQWEYEIRTLLHFGIGYDTDNTQLSFVPERQTFNYTRLRK